MKYEHLFNICKLWVIKCGKIQEGKALEHGPSLYMLQRECACSHFSVKAKEHTLLSGEESTHMSMEVNRTGKGAPYQRVFARLSPLTLSHIYLTSLSDSFQSTTCIFREISYLPGSS